MRKTLLTLILLIPAGCRSGGAACTLLYAYGVSATVTDVATGAPITKATLTLTDGSYQETMQSFGDGEYVGAGERAGTYTLTATAPGYQGRVITDIVVTADQCHVIGVHVDVQLQPAP